MIAVFIAWPALDFVIHGVMLQAMYEATAEAWRLMDKIKMDLMCRVTLVSATCFAAVFAFLFRLTTMTTGLIYGPVFFSWSKRSPEGFFSRQ